MSEAQIRLVPNVSGEVFQCQEYCGLDRTATIPARARCAECVRTDIIAGSLTCRQCGQEFRIVESVPWLFEYPTAGAKTALSDTVTVYNYVWNRIAPATSQEPVHIDGVEEALGEPVVQGVIGLDAGSGCGSDTATMAGRHPAVEVISLDMSEGVYATKHRTKGLPNVHIVRGSVLALPLRSSMCDFGYAFGVLHHTPDPSRGLQEIVRVLKPGGRVTLYLYEDHAGNPWKAIPLKVVTALRRLTTHLNTWVLSGLCYLLSPVMIVAFSIPARIMRRFGPTRAIAEQMPFNFGTTSFSVHADLLDRFGAPIEVRYSREGVVALLEVGGLRKIQTCRLKTAAGWVARGSKPAARTAAEVVG